MKNIYLKFWMMAVIFLMVGGISAQDWAITTESGSHTLKAKTASGTFLDIVAMVEEGDDCFMDVRAVENGKYYPVKLTISNEMEIPVFAVKKDGSKLEVVAVSDAEGNFRVKGVSRFGNTIRIAAVSPSGSFKDLIAKSMDGRTKSISGVKFEDDNVELEIGETKIVAHLKALPSNQAISEETVWDVSAIGNDGSKLEVVALNKKGKEYPIKAMSAGGSFTLLNVKAMAPRDNMMVKLTKNGNGIFLEAIDEYGRLFPVKIKTADGKYISIRGGDNCGKTIDIQAFGDNGLDYLLHAISPEGDMYDIKGIKVKDEDTEGFVQGLKGLTLYYAHVKALPPVQ
jgi:hypothetical protein